MKDNDENLNGALNDDAMEEVAGGKWSNDQEKALKRILGTDNIKDITKKYTSPQKFIDAMKNTGSSADEINMMKREFGI